MKSKLVILLITLLFLSGCWNYRELNEMSITGALGLDYNEEKQVFETTALIFNAKKVSGSSSGVSSDESPVTIFKGEGKTIHESLRKIIHESPRKLYLGHLETVIFGEDFAKNHMLEGMDFLFRDAESRKDFEMVVAEETTAYEILQILTPIENLTSVNIMNALANNELFLGTTSSISLDNLISVIYQDGLEVVLPGIKIVGEDPEEGKTVETKKGSVPSADLFISHNLVFKEEKLIGSLTEEESIGYNILRSNLIQTIISFPCDKKGNYATVETVAAKYKLNITIKEDIPKVNIEVKLEGTFSEINCVLDLKKLEVLNKLEKQAENKVKQILTSTIETAQKKYNSDILGFGEFLYMNEYKYWKKVKDRWYEIFPNIEYKIKVEYEIPKKGAITDSFKEKYYDTKK